jgi:hypothetical protein
MKINLSTSLAALFIGGFALSACATSHPDLEKKASSTSAPKEKTLVFDPAPERKPQTRDTMSQIERDVAEAAEKRWAALVAGDGKAAYALFSDGSKLQISESQFEKNYKKGFWKDAKVMAVKCSVDGLCDVSSLVGLAPVVRGAGRTGYQTPVTEKWIIQEGKPRFVFDSSPR